MADTSGGGAVKILLKLKRFGKEWEITGGPPFVVDGETFESYGPYRTRAEALDDKRGLQKFFDSGHDRSRVVTARKK